MTDAPTFQSLGLHDDTLRAIADAGYTAPTAVQVAAFEPVAAGRDVIVQSRTGSGKTAAFVLPIVDRLLKPEAVPQALVLCPTRELAIQVAGEFERLGQHRGATVVTIYGGAPMDRQVRALEAGVKAVVGTPGRVLDHLRRGTFDPSRIRVVVLDEGDEMLSMGFAEELNAILEQMPRGRQGVILSATMPESIRRIANRHLREPELIALSSDGIAPEGLTHLVYFTAAGTRIADLVRVLEQERPEAALVFCNMKAETEAVARGLQTAGLDAEYIHGDLAQSDRERVLGKLREGKVRFLVATDVAARGIDVPHLTHVVNFGLPDSAEAYVHRTGRTGRAGRAGTAITLAGPKDIGSLYFLRLTYGIRPIERSLPTLGEEKTRRELDRLQLLLEAFPGDASDEAVALARRLLTHDDAERVIASLVGAFFDLERRDRVTREVSGVAAEPAVTLPAPPPEAEPPARPVAERPRRDDARPPRDRSPRDRERPPARPAEPPRRPPTRDVPAAELEADEDGVGADMEELRIAVGRREGLRAGDLVKMLSEALDIPKRAIGRVHVRDRFTLVDLPMGKLAAALEALKDVTYNNQPLAPERGRRGATGDDAAG
ncbi:MAG: DEAD/DEAH box helicase [Polyangiales bacterium]